MSNSSMSKNRHGATQQSGAPYNRRMVLDLIRREGELSRKDLVARVGLSPQTVANVTQELQDCGLLVSKRIKGARARGQPPMAFALDPRGGDSIGFSVEPQRVSAALVNLVGDVLERREHSFDTGDPGRVLQTLLALSRELVAAAPDARRLWGIGVALPGPFDVPGMSFVGPTALDGWRDLSILESLQGTLALPVFYNTDSVAGALGESLFGVAMQLANFFYLHLGVGLGGTLLVDRFAFRGAAGNATEVGHIPIVPQGKPCYCGGQGCLERYLSLHALSEFMEGANAPAPSNSRIEGWLLSRDARAMEWCHQAAMHLRSAVGVIENLLDPETIVIGGSAPQQLIEVLYALAMPLRPSVRSGKAGRLLLSKRGSDSSLLGAAVLPIYELLAPRLHGAAPAMANHPAQAALQPGRSPDREIL